VKVVQTQQFRAGFQNIGEPVLVEKFGTQLGLYFPLNGGQVVQKSVAPRLFDESPTRGRKAAAAAKPREVARVTRPRTSNVTATVAAPPDAPVKRGRGRPKGSRNKSTLEKIAAAQQQAQGHVATMVPVHNVDAPVAAQ
jgi:hypothetical protein